MREIKFRAFENEKMHYFDLSDTIAPNMEMKVMQYTGLKDKKGKEIYEGDIIGDWTEVDGKMVQSKLQVFFDVKLGQWMLDCSNNQDKSCYYALFKELQDFDYEIIGNIHENPELI